MNKAGWKRRAKEAEAALAEVPFRRGLTFDVLTVCFPDKTFTLRGAVVKVDSNCVSFPLTNDQHVLAPAGWHPVFPAEPADA